jgi:uncharacterized protein (TIGR02246 family)
MPPVMETGTDSPEGTARAFRSAIRFGWLDAAAGLLAREACFVTPDSTVIKGRAAIRDVLSQLIAQRPEISTEPATVLVAGDVAFVTQRWKMRVASGAGSVVRDVRPVLVLRKEEDAWKLAITAPWAAVMRATD